MPQCPVKMNCRTNKNDPIDRGQTVEKQQLSLLCPVWQGLVDDYRTYCGITSFFKEKSDVSKEE
jgi:hypothetical protein